MYRVTTPIHTFTLPIDTATCKEIQVTYKQNKNELIKHYQGGVIPAGMTLNGKDVIIKLTQEESKAFTTGYGVNAQIRVLTTDNEVYASQIFTVVVEDVLNEEILADE